MTKLVLLALWYPFAALASDSGDVRIEKQDRAYEIRMSFDVQANPYRVRSVITDYRNPARLSSAVREREIISQTGGVTRIGTELRGCVVFFCRTITLVQDVTESDDSVRADVVPDGGDFRSGYLLWSIVGAEGGRSHVVFEAVMEPGFFVPPIIGGFLVRSALEKHVTEIARNLASEAALEASAAGEHE
jgi:hypothetical protein